MPTPPCQRGTHTHRSQIWALHCKATILTVLCSLILLPPGTFGGIGQFEYDTALPGNPNSLGGSFDRGHIKASQEVCDANGCRRKRCVLTRGNWCPLFERQQPATWNPPKPGDMPCPTTQYGECNRVGVCNYDFGTCDCPAGWQGDDCAKPLKRPCTNNYRRPGDPLDEPISHVGPDGRDRDWKDEGWTASRCAGYCDVDIALCYCHEGPFRHIPAPEGSPPGTPPIQQGRVLSDACMPKEDAQGVKNHWGGVPYNHLFGPNGWCMAEQNPARHCGCLVDGLHGHLCEIKSELYCINQCSGHGECNYGFCKCYDSWYGVDCSRRKKGMPLEPGDEQTKPWLQEVIAATPAAMPQPPAPTRKRPLIYVYDMPAEFTTRMLQYRLAGKACMWRLFTENNATAFHGENAYGLEIYLHEQLLASPHRTLDPEEADFFYVPLYINCYYWPVLGWADGPWYHAPVAHIRPMHAANFMLKAKQWVQKSFPFWDRRKGKDHIWLTSMDEGACYMPSEIYNTSIVLTHWGRMDLNHTSGTAWGYDYYNTALQDEWKAWQPTDWRDIYKGHPCYDPKKDLVVPGLKPPMHYHMSPLLGAAPLKRDILLYLRGDVGTHRAPNYSRGVRQKLTQLALVHDWTSQNIFIGERHVLPGDYSEHLARSKFCVVAMGDGFSMRAEDAILHGCIPVIFMDGVHVIFESIMEIDAFALRLHESAITPELPALLKGISDEQLLRMQSRLALVMHRFAYGHSPSIQQSMAHFFRVNTARAHQEQLIVPEDHPFHPLTRFPIKQDALSTIMQWLHSRIPDTR